MCIFGGAGDQIKALHMLDKCSSRELCPQPCALNEALCCTAHPPPPRWRSAQDFCWLSFRPFSRSFLCSLSNMGLEGRQGRGRNHREKGRSQRLTQGFISPVVTGWPGDSECWKQRRAQPHLPAWTTQLPKAALRFQQQWKWRPL